jgi:hypothetical protein
MIYHTEFSTLKFTELVDYFVHYKFLLKEDSKLYTITKFADKAIDAMSANNNFSKIPYDSFYNQLLARLAQIPITTFNGKVDLTNTSKLSKEDWGVLIFSVASAGKIGRAHV